MSGRNVALADGRFYYLAGAGWNTPASNAVSQNTLIAAAAVLHNRVRGAA